MFVYVGNGESYLYYIEISEQKEKPNPQMGTALFFSLVFDLSHIPLYRLVDSSGIRKADIIPLL